MEIYYLCKQMAIRITTMRKREMINYVNREKRMADLFGHSKDLITLSQILTYNNLYIIKTRGHLRKYTIFLAIEQGNRIVFYPY